MDLSKFSTLNNRTWVWLGTKRSERTGLEPELREWAGAAGAWAAGTPVRISPQQRCGEGVLLRPQDPEHYCCHASWCPHQHGCPAAASGTDVSRYPLLYVICRHIQLTECRSCASSSCCPGLWGKTHLTFVWFWWWDICSWCGRHTVEYFPVTVKDSDTL